MYYRFILGRKATYVDIEEKYIGAFDYEGDKLLTAVEIRNKQIEARFKNVEYIKDRYGKEIAHLILGNKAKDFKKL